MNAKGGSGKTTVAANLTQGYFAMKGASVALADFDPQGSSIDWLRQRRGNLPKIIGLEASEKFPKLSSTVDVMVMDAPSRTHDEQIVSFIALPKHA